MNRKKSYKGVTSLYPRCFYQQLTHDYQKGIDGL
ncbi:hypothetical protein Ppb6_00838 [Photorhabdus australis subsp. thailandensis]|uniref:Uncharacterized protein n=1 Tax=Photorhabdus australis subsp. thailandensis TaxID=2805096 RepID=A0A1C0U7N8_9GAMM|nr:hypothetical protein Ppb6_00838 [Photorhabdus australis subsp. thailandensis]